MWTHKVIKEVYLFNSESLAQEIRQVNGRLGSLDYIHGRCLPNQWNKHFMIYMSNSPLPQEMFDQEFNVCFVTLLPHASPMELIHAMKESAM